MTNRKVLLGGIGISGVSLVLSIGFMITVVSKFDINKQVEIPTVKQEPLVFVPADEGNDNVVSDDSVSDNSANTIEIQPESIQIELGMKVSDFVKAQGEPEEIREVKAAYVYEYPDLTYVVDELQETLIGYWIYAGQQLPNAKFTIDWASGFQQNQENISWDGPYYNGDRGSKYVLHGYANINGSSYTLEFGADDEFGYGNQLIAIYKQ
ncbi:MAG: hypothetical protein ACRC5Q_01545 [Culicoidibacterales bacterium]